MSGHSAQTTVYNVKRQNNHIVLMAIARLVITEFIVKLENHKKQNQSLKYVQSVISTKNRLVTVP